MDFFWSSVHPWFVNKLVIIEALPLMGFWAVALTKGPAGGRDVGDNVDDVCEGVAASAADTPAATTDPSFCGRALEGTICTSNGSRNDR